MSFTYEAERFIPVFEKNFTWIGGFMRNVRRYPQRPSLVDPAADKVFSYLELNDAVNRFANAMNADGIASGDVVLYQLYNSVPFALCYIAPQKIGAVNSPANFNLSPAETARLIDLHQPKVYVYDEEIFDTAVKALELCAFKPAVILCAEHRNTHTLPQGHRSFSNYAASAGCEEPVRTSCPNMYDEVTRLFTSGTTGTPKAVPLNNVNEVLSAHDVIMHYPLTPYDATMNMTPWFHRGGLHSGGLCPTLYAGGCCVILRMFSAGKCIEYASKYHVTFLTGVPSALSKLADRLEKHPTELPQLKGIVTMGSPLDKEDCLRYLHTLTPNIYNGYGTTETFWNSFLRPFQLPEMAGSAGCSCTDDEVRVIINDPDRRVDPEETVPKDGVTEGEIIISSWAKCSLSYFKDPHQTDERFYEGWYYTHDIGVWDQNSCISVRGRKDDMIICMGENIYPAQLEAVINSNPKVKDSMVIGVPDPSRGQAVAAYIIPADPSLTIQEINHYLTNGGELSLYKCPRYYCFTESLPYNSTGKKLHVTLQKQAEADLANGKLQRP